MNKSIICIYTLTQEVFSKVSLLWSRTLTASQPLQHRIMKPIRLLDLRCMTQIRKGHICTIFPNCIRCRSTQRCIIPQLCRDRRGAPLLANSGVILLPNHQERGRVRKIPKLIRYGLRHHHVGYQRLIKSIDLGASAVVHGKQHVDPDVVGRLPRIDVIGRLLIPTDRRIVRRTLRGIDVVDGQVRHALGLPILEADGIDEHKARHQVGIHEREACREHPAHRVAKHVDGRQIQAVEDRLGVQRELLQRELICVWLVGLAESNLVGQDDAVAL